MINDTAKQTLNQLRDIHLPPAIPFWPLAWGWYVLLAIGITAIVFGIFSYRRYKHNSLGKRFALQKLQQLKQQNLTPAQLLEQIDILLKRISFAYYPKNPCADLYGEEWVTYLNQKTKHAKFPSHYNQIFSQHLYQGSSRYNQDELLTLTKAWIKER